MLANTSPLLYSPPLCSSLLCFLPSIIFSFIPSQEWIKECLYQSFLPPTSFYFPPFFLIFMQIGGQRDRKTAAVGSFINSMLLISVSHKACLCFLHLWLLIGNSLSLKRAWGGLCFLKIDGSVYLRQCFILQPAPYSTRQCEQLSMSRKPM